MDPEDELWPPGPVALATALSGVPAILLILAFYGTDLLLLDPRELARTGAWIAFAGLAPSCFIGMPIALTLLREPRTSIVAWGVAGAVTGLTAVAVAGFWVFGWAFPLMIFSFLGEMLFLICVAAVVIGAVSGLVARGLLSLFLRASSR